jgi:hypothetical protein
MQPLTTLLLFAAFQPGPQQAPTLARYWDAVSHASSLTAAYAIVPPASSPGRHESDIARGLLLTRHYELAYDRVSAMKAIQTLRSVADKTPRDPWAHFALGVAYARSPDAMPRTSSRSDRQRASIENSVYARNGIREMKLALALDSSFYIDAIELADFAVRRRDQEGVQLAARTLERGAATGDPSVLIALAKLASRTGAAFDVDALLRRASHGDPSMALRQKAFIDVGDVGSASLAASEYFSAIDVMTPVAADVFYRDADPIATPAFRSAWTQADVDTRKALLRELWRVRAVRDGIPLDRRVALHLRELAANVPPSNGEAFSFAYARTVSFDSGMWQFRSPSGGAEVVAAVAVPYAEAIPMRLRNGVFDATLTLSLFDSSGMWTRQVTDTVTHGANAVRPGKMALLFVATAAPASPGATARIDLANHDESIGGGTAAALSIDEFDPDSLTMSDIVISPPDLRGSYRRGNVYVALAPGRVYERDEQPRLYYEIYGASEGDSLDTEITVGDETGFRFSERARGVTAGYGLQQERTIGLSRQRPGTYSLRVVIRDRTRSTVTERRATLIVR